MFFRSITRTSDSSFTFKIELFENKRSNKLRKVRIGSVRGEDEGTEVTRQRVSGQGVM